MKKLRNRNENVKKNKKGNVKKSFAQRSCYFPSMESKKKVKKWKSWKIEMKCKKNEKGNVKKKGLSNDPITLRQY